MEDKMEDKIKALIKDLEDDLDTIGHNLNVCAKLGYDFENSVQTKLYQTLKTIKNDLKDIVRKEDS